MKIAVIGTGYVGLVTGTCLAESGNDVIGIDKDQRKIEVLESGRLPIYEPGLLELVQRNRREDRLKFTTDLARGIGPAHLIFVAVGTPQSREGAADLENLWAVIDALAAAVTSPKVVVIKSTVPVGTNRAVAERLAARAAHPIAVVSNPEFLKEGAAVEDFMRPDRVVVGVRETETAQLMHELYAPFLRTERPFLVMSPESAEMTKYVANAMLATKISFINEMANLCERAGADINDVRRGIGHDARIGFQFLFPGAGYGGSCFDGGETVFVLDGAAVSTTTFQALFTKVATADSAGEAKEQARAQRRLPLAANSVAGSGLVSLLHNTEDDVRVIEPPGLEVLGFDLETGRPAVSHVLAVTRRIYRGPMIRLRTSMGRSLHVTADHPVIRWTGLDYEVVLAEAVQPGDQILALCDLPGFERPDALNLIDLLQGTDLEGDVHVSPTDNSFTVQYPRFAGQIPRDVLKEPVEIRRHNRMPLRLYRRLHRHGVLWVPPERLQLYTAKGAASKINAVIQVDADLLRLCGYFLAEGFICRDRGRAGAVRQRIGFSFHENEEEYARDVQRILGGWGLKYIEKRGPSWRTTLVSSRVFAWLLRDVLQCGTRSEDKALPRLAFHVSPVLRHELLRGAFSGDGAVTLLQGGRNLMLEYATVSKRLADGLALLLQTLGIVPSLRSRWMNKSTQPAYLLRVSGYDQVAALQNVFGAKHIDRIGQVLAGYQRHIQQRGFVRHGHQAVLTVRAVETEDMEGSVYSLETSTGTVIAGSGLVCHNCFPKDVRALIATARQLDVPVHLIEAVDRVNEAQKHVLFAKIRKHYGNLRGLTLAVWGVAFKPRTDDIREAPALALVDALLAEGVQVRVHDPEALANVRALYGDGLVYCDRPYGALEGSDGLAIVTEWQEFRNPDFVVMHRLLRQPVIFDGRNLYDFKTLAHQGFTYYAIGRAGLTVEK